MSAKTYEGINEVYNYFDRRPDELSGQIADIIGDIEARIAGISLDVDGLMNRRYTLLITLKREPDFALGFRFGELATLTGAVMQGGAMPGGKPVYTFIWAQ